MTKVKCPVCEKSMNINFNIKNKIIVGSKTCPSCGHKVSVDDFL